MDEEGEWGRREGGKILGTEGKAQAGTITRAGKLWECKERDTETLSLVLKGSRKKTDSCSSFPVLLIDRGEVGAQ